MSQPIDVVQRLVELITTSHDNFMHLLAINDALFDEVISLRKRVAELEATRPDLRLVKPL